MGCRVSLRRSILESSNRYATPLILIRTACYQSVRSSIPSLNPVRQGGAQRLGFVLVFSIVDLDHLVYVCPRFDAQHEMCIASGLAGAAVLTGLASLLYAFGDTRWRGLLHL